MKKPNFTLYIFAVSAIAVIILLVILLSPVRAEMPKISLPSPSAGTAAPPSGGELFPRAEITPENVQTVIKSLDPAVSYSRELTITTFWSGGFNVSQLKIYADSGRLLVTETVSNGAIPVTGNAADEKRSLYLPGKLYIWYGDGTAGVFSADVSADTADSLTRSISLSRALALPADSITAAGYADFDGVPCIFAEFTTENLRCRDIFYVDVLTGLLIAEDSYDGDTPIFSLRSGKTELSTPANELFAAPGNV